MSKKKEKSNTRCAIKHSIYRSIKSTGFKPNVIVNDDDNDDESTAGFNCASSS